MSIMGGYEIKISYAPYQVNYDHYYIRVSSSHRLKGSKVIISKHLIHPKYQMSHKFDYDVQLLILHRPLHCTKLVSPIRMSSHFGKYITVAGWGYQTEKSSILHC
ncbi:hypothetical protein HW555_004604 [Spodoptera exigua]|uniref:Peptidase S1 domain-containing protein n=1 Tax=Spodoptera exigua TaxID=7107 RepID=A0A835GKT8_SPOEX|nr:hypothetical protein HW555_004604 [Spodoptera exigua]